MFRSNKIQINLVLIVFWAFQVGVSQNHVDFQDRQLERSTRLIKTHEQLGTADKN